MSFFDGAGGGFGRVPGAEYTEGEDDLDTSYYDSGDGQPNETADESTVEFTGTYQHILLVFVVGLKIKFSSRRLFRVRQPRGKLCGGG